MYKIILILLISCSSIEHKPTNDIDLSEVINKVESDKTIAEDRKLYYLSQYKQAANTINSQAKYIIQLEEKVHRLVNENDSLKNRIADLSESKGRINQIDYQFYALIALIVLGLIGFILYILSKTTNLFSPSDIIKKVIQ